jgi:hypothetical protein
VKQGSKVLVKTKRITGKTETSRLGSSQDATMSCIDILVRHIRSRIALIDELIDEIASLDVTGSGAAVARGARSGAGRK